MFHAGWSRGLLGKAVPWRARLWAPWAVGVASAVRAGVEERAVGRACRVQCVTLEPTHHVTWAAPLSAPQSDM
jgi:hypothetical protein